MTYSTKKENGSNFCCLFELIQAVCTFCGSDDAENDIADTDKTSIPVSESLSSAFKMSQPDISSAKRKAKASTTSEDDAENSVAVSEVPQQTKKRSTKLELAESTRVKGGAKSVVTKQESSIETKEVLGKHETAAPKQPIEVFFFNIEANNTFICPASRHQAITCNQKGFFKDTRQCFSCGSS